MTASQHTVGEGVGHTPLPWKYHRNSSYWEFGSSVHGQLGDVCASHHLYLEGKKLPEAEAELIAEANAAFIVRACNSHYELLEALEGLLNALPSATTHPAIKQARAAISLATGKTGGGA